jgi:autotransporter translocation and assembly factor TamB
MKTWLKAFLIFIGAVTLCLLIFTVCLGIYADSDHFRNFLLRKINASIAGSVTVGGHEISFLSGSITLEKLAFNDQAGGRPANLEHLLVDIAYLPLLKRRLEVETLVLENPDIRLAISPDGTIDLVEAVKAFSKSKTVQADSPGGSIPWNVTVRNVRISGGDFQLAAESGEVHVALKRIAIQAKGDLFKKAAEIRLRVENTALAYGERRLNIHPLALSVILAEDQSATLAVEAKNDFADIAVDGEIRRLFDDPMLNLNLAFNVSLGEWGGIIELPYEFSGQANGKLAVRGNWKDPEADLLLAYEGGVLAGYSVDGLQVDLALAKRMLSLQRMDILAGTGETKLSGKINLQDMFPESFVSSEVYPDKAAYAIHAGLQHIDLAFLTQDILRVKGFINSTATIEGEGIGFKKLSAFGTIRAVIDSFFMEGMHQATDLDLNAGAVIKAGVVAISELSITGAETRLNASGELDAPSGNIRGRLTADTQDIQQVLGLFGVAGNSGAFSLGVDASGAWWQPEVGVHMTGKQIQLDSVRLGDIDLTATLDPNGLLNIRSLKLANQGTRAEGSGTVRLFKEGFSLHETVPLQAGVKWVGAKVSDFAAYEAIGGSFDGKLQLEGSVQSLQAAAVINGKDIAYEEISLGDVTADLRLFNGELLLDRLQLKNQSAVCSLTGGIQLFEPDSWHRPAEPVLNLGLQADAVTIQSYFPDIQGNLSMEAHLEGPLSLLKGEGHLKGESLEVKAQPIEKIEMDIELKDNRLHIPRLQAVVDQQSIATGSGWYDFDQRFAFDLYSQGMRLDSIDKIHQLQKVEGKLDWRIRGEGSISDPVIHGGVRVKALYVNNEKLDDFDFRIDLADSRLAIKGRQTFELDAGYHLLDKDFHIDLLFADTHLSPFFIAMGRKDVGGRITGGITARGNTASLKRSEVLLDISNLDLAYLGETLIHADKIQGDLIDQRLSIPEFSLNILKSGQLKIQGSGNLDGYFDVRANGEIPAASVFLLFMDDLEIKGDIRVHAEMKGPVEDPEFSAEIILQQVGGILPPTDAALKGINGRIRLTPSSVSIENITGNLGTGIFRINGDVALEKFRPGMVALELKATSLPIHVPETLDAVINTELLVAGMPENLSVEGDILLLEGVYYKNIKLNLFQKIKEKERPGGLPEEEPRDTTLSTMSYNIKLKYREPFMVDNNVAQLEIQPDLVFSGTLNTPVVSGSAKVQNGTVSYQNKVFVVKKGIINFVNPYKIEPEIDIEGSLDIRQWHITLTLYGSPDRLMVELSSTPPEEDADILSLLVFGKTTYEMTELGDGATDSTELLMAKVLASSFGDDIKKTTGLDYLEVKSETTEAPSGSDGIQVTVGKDLSERMSVKYSIGSGSSGYHQRAATEYKLLENILLSGFQDIKGSYGGEIIFRIEFR